MVINQNEFTYFRLSNQYADRLPIPKIPESAQQPFIYCVDRILAITNVTQPSWLSDKEHKQDACDTIKELERQIDQMVYKLYGLNDDEIEIVENSGR